eukprot:tig00000133_g7662.t1
MPARSPPPGPAPCESSPLLAHGAARGAQRDCTCKTPPLLERLANNRKKVAAWGVGAFILVGVVIFFVWGEMQAGWESADYDAFAARFCEQNPCTLDLEEEGYTFAAIGDWGRAGKHHQRKLAKAMGEICNRRKCKFIISVGDNFYPNGVRSVDDGDWLASYEEVYDKAPLGVRWYPTLGNHDYMGKPAAQIAYTKHSARWYFPARYYTSRVKTELRNGEVIELASAPSISPHRPALLLPVISNLLSSIPLAQPVLFIVQDAAAQLAWLDEQLAAARDADWRVVTGHHPLYSAAAAPPDDGGDQRRDERSAVRSALLPLFRKHKVDLYLCGHDHTMQHLKPKDGVTHYVVTGAGSKMAHHFHHDKVLFDRIEPDFFGSKHTGFFTFTILGRTRIQVTAYSRHAHGEDLRYVSEIQK